MKFFWQILILLLSTQLLLAESGSIRGVVQDSEDKVALAGASVAIDSLKIGISTDADGVFLLNGIAAGVHKLSVSFLGYETYYQQVEVSDGEAVTLTVMLKATPLKGAGITVVATRAVEGETPAAFSTLTREDIETRYYAQDIPVLLSELPSTTFYSDGGSGIGYNYLSIRGFDQRRVSVLINGVPQNDPEDHNVYWINFPDFLDNVEDIQVQRGAGNAFYGPPAIGGSINIITSQFSPERKISVTSGAGSYATRKLALGYNSGLLSDKFVVSARVSQLTSDSYRDFSAVDFKSYFIGAAHFGKRSNTRIHFYGGPIEDQLAYFGISKAEAEDRETRRTNYINDDKQIENFNQPHLEIINQMTLSDNLTLQNVLFGIRGYGFFDYDGSWAPFSYFRLTPEFGFAVDGDPEAQYASSLLIRAYVDNRQAGWFPNISWQFNQRGTLTAGSELRLHRSLHWGRIQEGSEDLPEAVSGDFRGRDYIGERRYYEYKGSKDVLSPYAKINYQVTPILNLYGSLQYVYQKYRLYDEAFIGTEFDLTHNFLNPHLGINVHLSDKVQGFVSYANTSREPRLKNFYDAAEASTPASWGAVVPQFSQTTEGVFDFNNPLVRPESLDDYEIGITYRDDQFLLSANYYYMDFQDEIVKSGQLDRFGQPITGNAEKSLHTGLELIAGTQITPQLSLSGNMTISRNELKKYTVFNGDGTSTSLDGNRIAGFPDFLANARLSYQAGNFNAGVLMQHVGRQFTDNTENDENVVDAYTVFHGSIGYNLGQLAGLSRLALQLHLQNILDELYISHGEGSDFFPAAERHFFLNLKIEM